MKHFFTMMLVAAAMFAQAQFITPGTGVRWDLDSLVTHSAGVVFVNGNHYEINGNITLSAGDTLEFLQNDTIMLHDLSYIYSYGKFTVDPPQQILFTALDTLSLNKWRGFRFYEGHETFIRNAVIEHGGGLKVNSGGTIYVEGSTFRRNYYKSGSTTGSLASAAVLDIIGTAEVKNCSFISNQRSAIASGSNVDSPIIFRNNYLFGNTTENSNRPQINLGPAGPGGTSYIIGNTVIGNGFTSSGGIAYSSLLGVAGDVVIDSNIVVSNRYGITVTGSGMNAWVRYNTLTDNNIQGNPDLGGSGLNFTASSTSAYQHVMVTGNNISGSLWGITIIGYPVVNLGNNDPDNYNPGLNVFADNGNNGILYDLYNNGPLEQYAMGNFWNVAQQNAASIEEVIVHQTDISTLGLVNYMPASQTVTFVVTDIQSNPLANASIQIEGMEAPLITNEQGMASLMMMQGEWGFDVSLAGYSTSTSSFVLGGTPLTVPVTLYDAVYALTFHVTDGTLPIAGAAINVGGFQITTNVNGIGSIGILPGTYDYEVTKEGYEPASGNVTVIDAPVTEEVVMTSIIPVYEYTVTFIVTSDDLPMEGAVVTIADTTLLTDAAGMATIDLEDGEYPYSVTAEGNNTVTGTANVNGADIDILIGLVTGITPIEASSYRIYPNPASSYVNLKGTGIEKIEFRTLQGNLLKSVVNPAERISVDDMPAGYYLVKIYTTDHTFGTRLIIK